MVDFDLFKFSFRSDEIETKPKKYKREKKRSENCNEIVSL